MTVLQTTCNSSEYPVRFGIVRFLTWTWAAFSFLVWQCRLLEQGVLFSYKIITQAHSLVVFPSYLEDISSSLGFSF